MSSIEEPALCVDVLCVDAQATAANGHLIELGWGLAGAEPVTRPIALPAGVRLPRRVAAITGLSEEALVVPLDRALDELTRAAAAAPFVVIHFARFELPLLRAAYAARGAPFPLDVTCTHEVTRRLLPELPRRGLRALVGWFGREVPPLRRAGSHVAATGYAWRCLLPRLAERGITTRDELRAWLATAPPRARRAFPMPRATRLALPRAPGVYRFLRADGSLLYVGKAACLRTRVNAHFGGRGATQSLEMLTQARDVAFELTATPLEAALLECDQIQRLAPPYNVALTRTEPGPERGPWIGADAPTLEEFLETLRLAAEQHLRDRARATCFPLLAGATVVYREPSSEEARLLRLERGLVVERATVPRDTPPPLPRSGGRVVGDRATHDRVRVLATELKRILRDGGEAALRWRRGPALAGARLQRALART